MSSIPPEMRAKVLELALQITNATLADDDALSDSGYQNLLEYYREETAVGRGHPFLTEVVADYTEESNAALRYYQVALEQSQRIGPAEPTQTILLGMTVKLLELGKVEQAEAYLRDAKKEAVRRQDEYSIAEADRLLKELPDQPV